ncbi:hypothetical protein MTR67_011807 [Solanum verrucosum]|uniref:Uncharacterized protein n=1 Tax=Solanum verrucosum TaxID=315347 RepID=A0AAF0Q8T2_SOLVR|nr:hypothetical protein MTR67_011807 [Solanum verrucosum]
MIQPCYPMSEYTTCSPSPRTADAEAPPSTATSQAARSSRATPTSRSTLVPHARVQKLETQMATLLQHMRP